MSVNYKAMLLDGRVIDSTEARGAPATLQVNRVIKGWTEALLTMKRGESRRLVIPPELAYGARGIRRRHPAERLPGVRGGARGFLKLFGLTGVPDDRIYMRQMSIGLLCRHARMLRTGGGGLRGGSPCPPDLTVTDQETAGGFPPLREKLPAVFLFAKTRAHARVFYFTAPSGRSRDQVERSRA